MTRNAYVKRPSVISASQRTGDSDVRRPPRLLGKSLRSISFCVVTSLIVAGCVPSLHPIYKKGQAIFDSELVGVWDAERGPVPGRWVFSRHANEASYRLEYKRDDETEIFRARLVKIGDQNYLDLSLSESNDFFDRLSDFGKSHVLLVHTFARLNLEDDTATISFLDPQWLSKLLSKDPAALRHERRGGVVITATTEELQAFIEKHADDAAAWHQKVWLKRQDEQERAPDTKSCSE